MFAPLIQRKSLKCIQDEITNITGYLDRHYKIGYTSLKMILTKQF